MENMTLLAQILRESNLLLEVSMDYWHDKIVDAVNNMKKVRLTYDDEQGGKGKNTRYILPVAYGESKAGNPVIRAYETMGSSKRGLTSPPNNREYPKWKLFRIDRIVSMTVGKNNFKGYADILKAEQLNMDGGDLGMTKYYAISPLSGKKDVEISDREKPIGSDPITKTDVEQNSAVTKEPDQPKTVDNTPNKPNIVNKLEAPETAPITKQDIQPNIQKSVDTNADGTEAQKLNATTDEPITKQDIVDPKDNEITRSYNDLMNRWNNMYKDEEENTEVEYDRQ